MSGGVEVIGLAGITANIEKAMRENRANIENAISDIGDVALWESVKRAPKDAGDLEDSIKKHMGKDVDGTSVAIVIPNNSDAASYALPMHEGIYSLGEDSEMKQARAGVEVGRKFITRGIEAGKNKFLLILKKELGV
ncbi:MAG: hypothetical protein IKA79_00580 [Lentisphaeria bacterium]|nr:hypothetical protein [Lentisphaeria bacterium]